MGRRCRPRRRISLRPNALPPLLLVAARTNGVIEFLTMKLVAVFALVFALLRPAGLQAAGCGLIKPDATDAVAASPGAHKVILENDAVRVLEASIPLHGTEPPHTHFWPSVFFEQTSGANEPWKTVKIRWS